MEPGVWSTQVTHNFGKSGMYLPNNCLFGSDSGVPVVQVMGGVCTRFIVQVCVFVGESCRVSIAILVALVVGLGCLLTEDHVGKAVDVIFGFGGGRSGGKDDRVEEVWGGFSGGRAPLGPSPTHQAFLHFLRYCLKASSLLSGILTGGIEAVGEAETTDQPSWAHFASAIPVYSIRNAFVGKMGGPSFGR